MSATFSLLLVNRKKSLAVVVTFVILPFILLWMAEQLWPVALQVMGLLGCLLLCFGLLLPVNWVFKRYALVSTIVELDPTNLIITYGSRRVVHLPLAQLRQYRHRALGIGHHLILYTTTGEVHLVTNRLHAVAANDSHMRALVQALAQVSGLASREPRP